MVHGRKSGLVSDLFALRGAADQSDRRRVGGRIVVLSYKPGKCRTELAAYATMNMMAVSRFEDKDTGSSNIGRCAHSPSDKGFWLI